MLNLDTHILIDTVLDWVRADERRLLETDFWCVSDIVIWEIATLHREGRTPVSVADPRLNKILGQITIWPISYDVGLALRRLDFRGDPADEIIAATSIAHDAPLLTRDQRLLASQVVPLAR